MNIIICDYVIVSELINQNAFVIARGSLATQAQPQYAVLHTQT